MSSRAEKKKARSGPLKTKTRPYDDRPSSGPGRAARRLTGLAHVCTTRLATVVVHVHDAGFGRRHLRDLVQVVGARQAGADVQELADPGLPGQVPDGGARKARFSRTAVRTAGQLCIAFCPVSRSATK